MITFAALAVILFAVLMLFLEAGRRKKEADRLAEENRELKNSLDSICGKLRMPADAIIGYSGLARRDGVSSEEKDTYLALIEEAGTEILHAAEAPGNPDDSDNQGIIHVD